MVCSGCGNHLGDSRGGWRCCQDLFLPRWWGDGVAIISRYQIKEFTLFRPWGSRRQFFFWSMPFIKSLPLVIPTPIGGMMSQGVILKLNFCFPSPGLRPGEAYHRIFPPHKQTCTSTTPRALKHQVSRFVWTWGTFIPMDCHVLPVVPHKAVAEVSKIGNL